VSIFTKVWAFLINVWVPHPPPYKNGEGLIYAQTLVKSTQRLSFWQILIGWFFVILGALLAVMGSVLGSDNTIEIYSIFTALEAQRGLFSTTAAIVSAGIGWHSIDRGSSSKSGQHINRCNSGCKWKWYQCG